MAGSFIYVVYAAMAFLIIVLGSGLWTMLKGGQPNKSQKMMRWRLGAQIVLILLVIAFVVFFKAG
ncbi:MAG: twin transmembrane helix small protein [OCS116 cluster bacterium]|uniref:HIG1 domain-containing protein n=1 Tax=OCS116 cluster bacterium TaxID=2030921 RepID=A0A2A4Z3V7_9PROT|nr:twin transmembrane helix small protein [OCS116 cluster bacterium]